MLAQRKVDGLVSAGNTGAMVAGGMLGKRFLKNVHRPGIATMMPTLTGTSIMIDVGANINPKAEQLYQYGVMGSIFARHILQKPRPTIGLMNIGSEEAKGHDLAKDTHTLFNASPLREQFIGNIEGRDVNRGTADVIVTDGFVGNVVLKTSEGVFEFAVKKVIQEVLDALTVEREKAEKALHELMSRYDYSAYGGAPLLGIDGICIICHGSSRERAIKNALAVCRPLRPGPAQRTDRPGTRKQPRPVCDHSGVGPICNRPRPRPVTNRSYVGSLIMARIAFLFPGQGAQYVGMGKTLCESLPAGRRLFEEASAILGYDLLAVCVNGPAERLDATAVSQPAIFVASLAALEGLRQANPEIVEQVTATAGLSLGEYSALVFAGALDFAEGLRVVQQRGQAMQAAADARPGGMVSIIGLERPEVEELVSKASQQGLLRIANLLCPGNIVVSGEKPACAAVEKLIAEGRAKTVRLAVAGAFHTSLMQPADQKLAQALSGVTLRSPRVPVYSNVDARPHTDPGRSVNCWCGRWSSRSCGSRRSADCSRPAASASTRSAPAGCWPGCSSACSARSI